MLISVVIPIFNKEKYIRNTIRSILDQSYENIEIIIVNDGSTDNSIYEISKIKDDRIRIINKHNGGPSSARNEGVRHAQGDWIFFMDADDILLPDSLRIMSQLVSDNPDCSVFVANYYMKKGSIFKPHSLFIKDGLVSNNFRSWFWENLSPCQGSTIYKKELLLKNPYPEELRRWEDASMFFEIMKSEKIYITSHPTFVYVLDNSCASHGLKDINQDFLGHLNLDKNSDFWQRMSVLLLHKQALRIYPHECNKLYGKNFSSTSDNIAFDLLMICKYLVRIISKLINTIRKPTVTLQNHD